MEGLQEFGVWMRQFWVVWLMILFLGIVAWVLWPRRKGKDLERHARIPMEDDDPHSGPRQDGDEPPHRRRDGNKET